MHLFIVVALSLSLSLRARTFAAVPAGAAGTPLGRAFARGARTEREPVQEPGGEHLLLRDAPFFFFVMPR